MKLELPRGMKDYPPSKMIASQGVLDRLRTKFELYGFVPLSTPVVEKMDILAAKYAGGSEIMKETFRLTDQGKRELGLRYDLTVPLARYIGMNPNFKSPFKRYQIGEVFRDGPVKLGRQRSFIQCDIDTIGCKSMMAESEIIQMTSDVFDELGLKVNIEINNRKILDSVLESLGVKGNLLDVIVTIDKIKKVEKKDIEKELKSKGVSPAVVKKLFSVFEDLSSNKDKIKKLRKVITTDKGQEGLDEIEEVLNSVKSKNVIFRVGLARGLAYYTSTVFEVFMSKGDFKSSLAGGGRYDKMIGDYLGRGEIPAVGISFGIEPITVVIDQKTRDSVADVFVLPIKTSAVKIAKELRESGVKVEVDIMGRGISKNLDYANSKSIPYVVIFGQKELKSGKVKLKDMQKGTEIEVKVKDVVSKLIIS